MHQPSKPSIQDRLQQAERSIFSQNGEDGVLSELFAWVGTDSKYFVEFGCEDGVQRNTRYLEKDGWTGLLMSCDGRPSMFDIKHELVTAENINSLFGKYRVPYNLDLLSVDIDGNDYWVWRALSNQYRPRLVVIEYNAKLGWECCLTVPYKPEAEWDISDHFGASLAALDRLGAAKGYRLVYCCKAGVNAFLVRNDLIPSSMHIPPLDEVYRPLFRDFFHSECPWLDVSSETVEDNWSDPPESSSTPEFAQGKACIHPVPGSGPKELMAPLGSENGQFRSGAVILCTSTNETIGAWVTVQLLRRVGYTFPIKILQPHGNTFDADTLSCIDTLGIDHSVRFSEAITNYQSITNLPPLGDVIHNAFQFDHVLLLHADTIPLKDPAILCEDQDFEKSGAIVWNLRNRLVPGNGRRCNNGPKFVDVRRWSVHLSCREVEGTGVYDWEIRPRSGVAHAQTSACASLIDDLRHDRWIPSFVVYCNAVGEDFFQQRLWANWMLNKNRRIKDFQLEDECLKAIGNLRNHRIAKALKLQEDDLSNSALLAGQSFWYIRCRHDFRRLSLGHDFEITDGAGNLEHFYVVQNNELLVLDSEMNVICRLQRHGDLWVGRWTQFERMPIVLEPLS